MKVICVDDEQPVLDNFKVKVKDFPEIESLHLFSNAEEALQWVEENSVDVAFLDIEMSGINGIELAKRLRAIDWNIRIIFVTAFDQYALDAFGVNALGYILKPYTREEVREALERAALMQSRPKNKVAIQTIPDLSISVNGNVLHLGGAKQVELMALLVDRGESGITVGEAIACLWPERTADESTQRLYRVTFYNLMTLLKEAGIDSIIGREGRKKFIDTRQVECDLYRILSGDAKALQNYGGYYLKNYSWAEPRNAQLDSMRRFLVNETIFNK